MSLRCALVPSLLQIVPLAGAAEPPKPVSLATPRQDAGLPYTRSARAVGL